MDLSNVKLLDCTIRDGGYINDWDFPLNFAQALYRSVSEAGVDYAELGFYFGESRDNKSPWANYQDSAYREVRKTVAKGASISCLLNYGGFNTDEIPPASETAVDMLRVACHQVDAANATSTAAILSQKGYETAVNYMGISNYTPSQLFELVQIINDHKEDITYFYVADSFGSLMPIQTRRIFDTLKYGTCAPLGFHPHNNLQMAFANSLLAIEAGADIVDSSVFGIGRGAGNLFTEVMLAYLESEGETRCSLLPILQFADLFMEPLREEYDWGISLPQMISGILKCHPNYSTNLLDFKMHTADDIYRMLSDLPVERRKRFKREYMDEARDSFLAKKLDRENLVSSGLNNAIEQHTSALLLCGGASVYDHQQKLTALVEEMDCCVFTVNNPGSLLKADAVFFGNQRRLLQYQSQITEHHEVIVGPTINEIAEGSLPISNISRLMLTSCKEMGFTETVPKNSGIMAILACAELGFETIYIAGMDGFSKGSGYYYQEDDAVHNPDAQQEMDDTLQLELKIVEKHLRSKGVSLQFVTPTTLLSGDGE